jgi:hypothetical protein
MKHRIGSLVGSLGCAALLVVACGGSSFEGAEGAAGMASGGESAAGKASGGSANGGSTSGGTASSGSSSGGNSSGGTNRGGNSSGGVSTGGVSVGGTSAGGSGGSPAACNEDTDCAACRYATAPKTAIDCYCPSCGQTPLPKSTCTANQTAWEKQCSATPLPCPAIACVEPPVPQCKSHMCVIGN